MIPSALHPPSRGRPRSALTRQAAIVAAIRAVPAALMTPAVRAISGRVTLGSAPAAIELRPVRRQHGSAMLLVFTAGYNAALLSVIARESPSVERVFAEHLPRTVWATIAR